MLNDENATLLEYELVYDDAGKNKYKFTYVCPCGNGKIEFLTSAGFIEKSGAILCPDCKEKYELEFDCEHAWEVKSK